MPSRNLLLRAFGPALDDLKPYLVPISLKAGQVLNEPGQKAVCAYFPASGLISARALLETGHEMECVLVGRTHALGAVAALGHHTALTRDVCLFDAHAWTIGLAELEAAMERSPAIDRQLKRFCFAQMAYAIRVGVCNAMHTAEQRLARWLLTAADLLGQPEIRLPQEEFAMILGLQRSVINPTLQRFREDGLIELGRGRLVVLDVDRLGRRACECHAALHRGMNVRMPEYP